MAGKNSRWKKGNTRYPKIVNGRADCAQKCTGRQRDELERAGTPNLNKYREEDDWHNGARVVK